MGIDKRSELPAALLFDLTAGTVGIHRIAMVIVTVLMQYRVERSQRRQEPF
ncbi:hypothetical protein [Halomonas sp. THAF5a]|uniref:hypothetical protein n=1 Tax=Halomonas sp. THAF5a TaxID=2587844 RepID=UPI001562341F|nr:hypothetical protein [Halomonas sp. THAF5a]